MSGKADLADIFRRMGSDYIPEKECAAGEYIQEGYPTELILDRMQKTNEPNLVSMYLYICSKLSDEETLNAWRYLRQRIESEADKFSRSLSIMQIDRNSRHLLYSARKYLLIERECWKRIDVFISHIKAVNNQAKNLRKFALRDLDVPLDLSGCEDCDFNNAQIINNIRSTLKQNIPGFEILSDGSLSEEEINYATQISTPEMNSYCCRILEIEQSPLFLYQEWLIYFFFDNLPDELPYDSRTKIITRDFIKQCIGYNKSVTNRLLSIPEEYEYRRLTLSTDDVKKYFSDMRELVLTFSFDEYIIEAEAISEHPNFNRYWENKDAFNSMLRKQPSETWYGRPYFRDVPCLYYDAVDKFRDFHFTKGFKEGFSIWVLQDMLNRCENVEFRLDMLDRVESIYVALWEKDKEAFAKAVIDTNLYFFQEQDIFKSEDIHGFSNALSHIEKNRNTEYYEAILLPYLSVDALLDIGSVREMRAYRVLDVLLQKKSIHAYNFTRSLLSSDCMSQLRPPTSNYWDFNLREFYKSLWVGNYIERPVWDIGMDWEILCQNIIKAYNLDVLTNHDGICLVNGTIPDVMVGTIKRNEDGKVVHASRIIECKKSFYFTGFFGTIHNNNTTDQYNDYCDILEYWILEKDTNLSAKNDADSQKIKCVFADDLLDAPWLAESFKQQIRILFEEVSRRNPNPSQDKTTIEELCAGIDHLIKFPPPDIPVPLFWRPEEHLWQKKRKKKKQIFVIRQFTLDGTFLMEFKSVQDAANAVGLRVDAITNATSGRRNSAGGFLWRKCEAYSQIENIVPQTISLSTESKLIYQVDQNGEVIATFESMSKAEKLSGVNRRSISDALKGVQKTAGGFTWVLGNST